MENGSHCSLTNATVFCPRELDCLPGFETLVLGPAAAKVSITSRYNFTPVDLCSSGVLLHHQMPTFQLLDVSTAGLQSDEDCSPAVTSTFEDVLW